MSVQAFDWKRRVLVGGHGGLLGGDILGFGGQLRPQPLGTQAFLVLLVFLGLATPSCASCWASSTRGSAC